MGARVGLVVALILAAVGPVRAECTSPGCYDGLVTALVLMLLAVLVGLGLVIWLTVRLIRRGRGGMAALLWGAIALILVLPMFIWG